MNANRITTLTAGLLIGFGAPVLAQQGEIIERMPDQAYVANWQPVFTHRIVSYVQLPFDSLEYKKIKMYVRFVPKAEVNSQQDLLSYRDLSRQRYLGAVLVRTGRKFEKLLDASVLGVENTNLTVEDQLINNEMVSTR